jgi:hypothetical protein
VWALVRQAAYVLLTIAFMHALMSVSCALEGMLCVVCETRRAGTGLMTMLPTVLGSQAGTDKSHDFDSMSLGAVTSSSAAPSDPLQQY